MLLLFVVLFVLSITFCCLVMRSRTFGLSCKKRFFSPFYPSYVKRGLIFLPVVRGCNLTQKIFRLFRNISPIISFGTFFTAFQEPQFHSSVWRYREHLQKTPGISITAGKTIQNFYFCCLIRNRSTLGQNYLFVCFFIYGVPIITDSNVNTFDTYM